MSRNVLVAAWLLVGMTGCGGSAPTPPAATEPAVDLGASSPVDPTPVLPIPDNVPSGDSEPASQPTIKPIPDDEKTPQAFESK